MVKIAHKAPDFPPAGRRGRVSKAPGSLTAPMTVTIESFDDKHRYAFQIRRWMPRGSARPSVGDECLVVDDETGEPWVVAWWPS